MNVIAAEGLLLEPQLAEHAAEMFTVLSDPAIYEHEGEPPASVEWLRDRFARLESRQSPDGRERWLNWVIRLPSARLAGYVQATVHPGGRAGIAYVLASKYWGRGLAQRAVEAMIGELREHFGVTDLSAVLKRSNLRSRRLLERLGFETAPPEVQAREAVEADELLMHCRVASRAQEVEQALSVGRRLALAVLLVTSVGVVAGVLGGYRELWDRGSVPDWSWWQYALAIPALGLAWLAMESLFGFVALPIFAFVAKPFAWRGRENPGWKRAVSWTCIAALVIFLLYVPYFFLTLNERPVP